jgi:phosphotransferase family enzyme
LARRYAHGGMHAHDNPVTAVGRPAPSGGEPALPLLVQARIAEVVAAVPGLSTSAEPVLRLTDKAVTTAGSHRGRPAVIKILLADAGYWRDRFEHETLLYRGFAARPPAFVVPDLYFAGPRVLVVQRLPGRAAHTDRYPPPLSPAVARAMVTALINLSGWQPPATPVIPGLDLDNSLGRVTASRCLALDDASRIRRILCAPATLFAHGDPLASNALTGPSEGNLAWIDLEHSGPYPPGADLALLGLFLGRHDPAAEHRCRAAAAAAGWRDSYSAMRALWIARERRLYHDLFTSADTADIRGWLGYQAELAAADLQPRLG